MDASYNQPTKTFNIFDINQITIGERAHGKYCGSALQPAGLHQANSSGKGPTSLHEGRLFRKGGQLAFIRAESSGKGPSSPSSGPTLLERGPAQLENIKKDEQL